MFLVSGLSCSTGGDLSLVERCYLSISILSIFQMPNDFTPLNRKQLPVILEVFLLQCFYIVVVHILTFPFIC